MSTTQLQILLTGVTGYIGGSILTSLLDSPSLKNATITLLLRNQSRAETLTSKFGDRVKPIVYKDLDDLSATTAAASKADLVINAGPGFHFPSTQALLRGLAQRKKETGNEVWMIQTSGTSNVADRPYSKVYEYQDPEQEFDDAKDDIYAYEKSREELQTYGQRSTELGVVDLGLELGVKTLVIMSPLIFGQGTGLWNQWSIQIPALIRGAIGHGRAIVVGDGHGVWDHVHIVDLAELYTIIALRMLEGREGVPIGKRGIIFSGNGRHAWKDVSQKVADVLVDEVQIESREVESVSLSEGTQLLKVLDFVSDEAMIELGLCSNSRTVSTVGRSLGWKPTRGEEAFDEGFKDDVRAVLAERK
jgi:nucleoside-diphosphate-sugar epimerase